MKERIIQYWQTLNAREQKMLLLGAGFLLLCLLYIIVQAEKTRAETMRQNVENELALLAWMQPAVTQIMLEKSQGGEVVQITAQNLLEEVEISLREVGLYPYLGGLDVVASQQVQLTFDNVVYETLVAWLHSLASHGVLIVEFTAKKAPEVGRVQASVLLSAAQ